jgi:uncharacterized protein YdiU (UPF0061 family)
MNTDNMSIMGLTIDYGPYGWLDDYDPNWTPNTTDAGERRYRYGQQPQIAFWNLVQLANAIYPLIDEAEPLQQALNVYNHTFDQKWNKMMADKLGFKTFDSEVDKELTDTLFALLAEAETDMTIFYRQLAQVDVDTHVDLLTNEQLLAPISEAWYRENALTDDYKYRFAQWMQQYMHRLQTEGIVQADKIQRMNAVNPKYVLRNYLAQLAFDKADEGDYSMVNELLDVMRHPYDDQPEKSHYAVKRPEWARDKAGCSQLSCSS